MHGTPKEESLTKYMAKTVKVWKASLEEDYSSSIDRRGTYIVGNIDAASRV